MKEELSIALPQDIFSAACPTRQLITRIADKWSILLLMALAQQPHYFGELQRKMDCISHKMLTQSLRKLEDEGFVTRTVVPGRIVKVRYQLTTLGSSLIQPLSVLWQWATIHGDVRS